MRASEMERVHEGNPDGECPDGETMNDYVLGCCSGNSALGISVWGVDRSTCQTPGDLSNRITPRRRRTQPACQISRRHNFVGKTARHQRHQGRPAQNGFGPSQSFLGRRRPFPTPHCPGHVFLRSSADIDLVHGQPRLVAQGLQLHGIRAGLQPARNTNHTPKRSSHAPEHLHRTD